jgi:hypothetical protein
LREERRVRVFENRVLRRVFGPKRDEVTGDCNIIFCYIYYIYNILYFKTCVYMHEIKIYRNKILPAVLYGCETWSLTLNEECRLRVFENRVLRRIFGPKWDEVTGEWRKLLNEELIDF